MGLVFCEVIGKLLEKLGLPIDDLQEKMKSVYSGRNVKIEFGKPYKLRGKKQRFTWSVSSTIGSWADPNG